jgi:uridine phosphorylase
MSIPNKPGKHIGKAVIEPAKVIYERKQSGLHPSSPVPAGAIICYDSSLWQWIGTLPGRVECDGWLRGSYLLPHGGSWILVSKAAGFGAPTAVMTLEELVAFGITKFVNLGAAGGLQKNMQIGDIVICDRAIRDEGTSHHYLPDGKYAYACKDLTEGLCAASARKGIPYRKATSWTIDAPYRETVEELRFYRNEGVATVEMEASALFAVGTHRGVSVSSIFAISDILSEDDWNQGYHSEEKNEGLKQIFEVALETIALNGGNRQRRNRLG